MRMLEKIKWRLWWFIRPKHLVGVFIAVIRDNKILIVNKKRGIVTGYFLPGGGKEYNLSFSKQAKKELREETGIIALELKIIGVYSDNKCRCVDILLLAVSSYGKIRVRDKFEIESAGFIPIGEIDKYLSGKCLEMARLAIRISKNNNKMNNGKICIENK